MSTHDSASYGARVYKIDERTVLIKQTVKKGEEQNSPYVIDEHREAHVDIFDDTKIANAVRSALSGKLQKGK